MTKVRYASTQERTKWLQDKLNQWCALLASAAVPDEKLFIAAFHLFSVIQVFALTTKHIGFLEEQEWRLIYMPDRDQDQVLKDQFDYVIGSRGVEPKLKLKIAPLPGVTPPAVSLDTLLNRIILGPTVSSPLARNSVLRMLEKLGKSRFADKVVSSSIPLRPVP